MAEGVVDEIRFAVSPYLWARGPRIFDDLDPVRLDPRLAQEREPARRGGGEQQGRCRGAAHLKR